MKGPFERLKYDLRRVWECPACHRRDRTSFTTTYVYCTCKPTDRPGPVSMRLVEDGIRRVWGEMPQQREPMTLNTPPVISESQPAEPIPAESFAETTTAAIAVIQEDISPEIAPESPEIAESPDGEAAS